LILADSNIWLALSLSAHVHQDITRAWFDGVADPGTILFCRATQQSFLRLLTSAAVLAPYGNQPLTNSQAWDAYETLLSDERITFAGEEPQGIATLWRDYGARRTSSPKLWMDAYLAAFAVRAGCRMVTTDTAFRQFHGLDVLVLA
jgi:toxin-antitoxin system PIN domain toxin